MDRHVGIGTVNVLYADDDPLTATSLLPRRRCSCAALIADLGSSMILVVFCLPGDGVLSPLLVVIIVDSIMLALLCCQ